jgi:crotonobetainyl-CoA:carnitine CoA-transferase CaiB-like acyl-CoA transferase
MPRPSLDGARILAVSRSGAGSFGTEPLAGLGPDGKIEDPGMGGDVTRSAPPFARRADLPYVRSFDRGEMR